jgi:hypothetical protein
MANVSPYSTLLVFWAKLNEKSTVVHQEEDHMNSHRKYELNILKRVKI